MSTNQPFNMDRKVLLSALWIFVMFNMIYADIVNQLIPSWNEDMEGYREMFNGGTLLMFALLLEIPIAMTLLSRILSPQANRWAHTLAVPITCLFVMGGGTSLEPFYIFFASMEVAAMLAALWLAWKA